jgi:hypothetical protein
MTRCSSRPDSFARSAIKSAPRRIMAETSPFDNSNAELRCSCFRSSGRSVALYQERNFRSHGRIQWAMDRDQVVLPDELVKLDIVHMAALADLRCVKNRKHIVGGRCEPWTRGCVRCSRVLRSDGSRTRPITLSPPARHRPGCPPRQQRPDVRADVGDPQSRGARHLHRRQAGHPYAYPPSAS